MWQKVFRTQPHATMAIVALGSFLSAVAILNPRTNTLETRGWRYLAGLGFHVGGVRFYPDESSWGAVILVVSIGMWLSLYCLSAIEDDRLNLDRLKARHPDVQALQGVHIGRTFIVKAVYNLIVLVWAIGGTLWFTFMVAFVAGNPAGILSAWLVAGSAASFWTCWRVRDFRAAEDEGGAR